jgi:hypothetical protein
MSFVAVQTFGNLTAKLAQGIGVNFTLPKVPSMHHRADFLRTQCNSRAQAALFQFWKYQSFIEAAGIEILDVHQFVNSSMSRT